MKQVSLPCSQETAAEPYPVPVESSPHPYILFLKESFYYSTVYV